MTEPSYLVAASGRRLAYHRTAGAAPGIVFLGGFASDMEGTKALHLEGRAQAQGRAFLRFDYSGHGSSDGAFIDGAVGDWTADALAAIDALTAGPQVLVGSSMGGWIALLVARARPQRLAGLVGVAAAPDFTEDALWAAFSAAERARLAQMGRVTRPSAHSDAQEVYTRRLIEDGRDHLVLRTPLALPFPVRLLQGTADMDVTPETARRLLEHADGPDLRLTLVKDADHRFSTPACLALLDRTVAETVAAASDAA